MAIRGNSRSTMVGTLNVCLSGSDPLPIDFVLDKRLRISWFPRLLFRGRCRYLEFTITIKLNPNSKGLSVEKKLERNSGLIYGKDIEKSGEGGRAFFRTVYMHAWSATERPHCQVGLQLSLSV